MFFEDSEVQKSLDLEEDMGRGWVLQLMMEDGQWHEVWQLAFGEDQKQGWR